MNNEETIIYISDVLRLIPVGLMGFGFLISFAAMFTTDRKGVIAFIVGILMILLGLCLIIPELLSSLRFVNDLQGK